MNTLARNWLAMWLITGAAASANAEGAEILVGGAAIELPAPVGFFRFDGKNANVDKMIQALVTPTNRLLACYGSESDLADALKGDYPPSPRNFNAQSFKKVESLNITPAFFAQLKSTLRKDMPTNATTLADNFADMESNASAAISKEIKARAELKVGDVEFLGFFDEKPDSLSFAMLTKIGVQSPDFKEPVETVSIVGACVLLVRNRAIFLYCTSDYNDKQDMEWVRTNTKKWRDEVLAANPSSSPDGAGVKAYNSSPLSLPISLNNLWSGALGNGLAAALIVAMVAGAAALTRLFKK